MSIYAKSMARKSNEDLLNMMLLQPHTYEADAVLAAEKELKERNYRNADKLIQEFKEKHFEDLSDASEDDINDYMEMLISEQGKPYQDALYILKMGNVNKDYIAQLEFSQTLQKEDEEIFAKEQAENHLLYGSLIIIGGIITTVISMTDAGSTGTYFISTGALLAGGVKLFRAVSYYILRRKQ